MKITPELIDKYLSNSCTVQEKRAVDDWYKSFSNQPDPLRLMSKPEQERLKHTMYNRFKEGLGRKGDTPNPFTKLYVIAGALTGMAALILLVSKLSLNHQQPSINLAYQQNIQVAFRNASLSICKKVLPDQSTVWLSPNSTITYPKVFTGSTRKVTLLGEAFFEVTKDREHPFIISSNELTTKVWGTSFRVRAFHNTPAEVSVVTGKVSVNKNNSANSVMLLPNQKATLVNHSSLVKRTGEVVQNEMRIWKRISLSFDDTRMGEVFKALNRSFGIHIYSNDTSMNDLAFTGDFTDQSLPSILDMIQQSINATYTIEEGKSFVFKTK